MNTISAPVSKEDASFWFPNIIVKVGLQFHQVITFRSGCCEMENFSLFLMIVLKLPAGLGGTRGAMLALTGCLWSIGLIFRKDITTYRPKSK